MDKEAARAIASSLIQDGCSIIDEATIDAPEGWFVPYQTDRFIASRDLNDSIVGNWPIFVSRDGTIAGPRRPPLPD